MTLYLHYFASFFIGMVPMLDNRKAVLLVGCSVCILGAFPVLAATSSGIDTAPSVNSLPLSVQGTPYLT